MWVIGGDGNSLGGWGWWKQFGWVGVGEAVWVVGGGVVVEAVWVAGGGGDMIGEWGVWCQFAGLGVVAIMCVTEGAVTSFVD